MATSWTAGDVSASATLTDSDHLYPGHINELRVAVDTHAALTIAHSATGAVVGTTNTQTLTNKTLTSAVLNTAVSGTAVLDEDNMASNSATKVATQQSIKAYVDSGTVTMTNKTLTSAVLTTPQINDTSADHQYIFAVSELAADRTVTLPLLTGNDEFVFKAHTQTLTNKTLTAPVITGSVTGTATFTDKRITKRITIIVSHATPTVNTDNCDIVSITALAAAITSMTTNLSGTETNGQVLVFRILDNGTGRAITWGAAFEPRGFDLPTTTTASKLLTVGFIYDTVDSIFGCVAVADEA